MGPMSLEIAVPFTLDSNGSVATTSDPDQQIRQHVLSLINTAPSERSALGTYGVALPDYLFSDTDQMTQAALMGDIRSAFAFWEPGIAASGITVAGSSADGTVTIDVKYARTDAPNSTKASTHTNVAVISAGGYVNEVVTA